MSADSYRLIIYMKKLSTITFIILLLYLYVTMASLY